jgi:hypothetical protein
MKNNSKFSFILIGISSVIVVLFLPFGVHIDLGPGPSSILSMVWEIPLEPSWYSVRYFSAFQYFFVYSFFRLLFFLEIGFLFVGKFSKLRFFLIGLISELIPLALSIPAALILNSQGENLSPIIFPIPLLLIFDLTLIWFINKKGNNIVSDITA